MANYVPNEDKLEDIDVRTAWSEVERRYLIESMPLEMHESIFDSDDENDSLLDDLANSPNEMMDLPPPHTHIATTAGPLTHKPPVVLFTSNDGAVFPSFQVMLRKTIELFEAKEEDVRIANNSSSSGGQRGATTATPPIVLGQVGLRCHACAQLAPHNRAPNATLFPTSLEQVYQSAQNLAANHIIPSCPCLSNNIRSELLQQLAQCREIFRPADSALWLQRTRELGVYQDHHGVPRFVPPAATAATTTTRLNGIPSSSMDGIWDD